MVSRLLPLKAASKYEIEGSLLQLCSLRTYEYLFIQAPFFLGEDLLQPARRAQGHLMPYLDFINTQVLMIPSSA